MGGAINNDKNEMNLLSDTCHIDLLLTYISSFDTEKLISFEINKLDIINSVAESNNLLNFSTD